MKRKKSSAMSRSQPIPARRTLAFLVNPTAGHPWSWQRLRVFQALQKRPQHRANTQVSVVFAENKADLVREAQRRADDPEAVVIAVGGDGTMHAVANALVGRAGRFGVLPTGSGNDFASLLAPANPRCCDWQRDSMASWLDHYQSTPAHPCDVARVSIEDDAGRREMYMINSLGIGIEGAVAHTVANIRFVQGLGRYLAAAVWQLVHYRAQPLEWALDGEQVLGSSTPLLVSVGNGRRAGGGFLFHPKARIDDGRLDVCWVENIPKWRQAMILPTVFWGGHGRFACVHQAQTQQLRFTADRGVAIHVDGECISTQARSIHIDVVQQGLSVVGWRPSEPSDR